MKFVKYLNIIMVILALTPSMRANDSITSHRNKQLTIFATGAGFTTIGAISNTTFGNWNISQKSNNNSPTADIIQYAPHAFPWALKALGVPTRSGWGRMATSQGISAILMGGTVSIMKDNISSMRPDGNDARSFPSGHSAWVYMGATMVAYEFGWKSPWYSLGAYSVASTIAMQRIIDRRHLPKDVIAGAGIGILATQAGYIIGDLLWGNKQIDNHFEKVKTPNKNNHSLSLINAYSISLNKLCFEDFAIKISPGFEAGLKWHAPLYNNISFASTISLQSTPLYTEKDNTKTYIAPLNSLRINITPGYHITLNKIYSMDLYAGCIYSHNFTLKSPDKSISSKRNTLGGIANIAMSMRMTDNFSIGANIGYEIHEQQLHVNPSKIYGFNHIHRKSEIINFFNIGISTVVNL